MSDMPNIYDAESWRDEQRPKRNPHRQRYDAACIARDLIGKQMREWCLANPAIGSDYEALVVRWVDAQTLCDALFDVMFEAELQARQGAAA